MLPAPRAAWALTVTALSLGSSLASAVWLQAGYDAARTGASSEAGPVADEVAWTIQLPGSKAWYMPPLIFGGGVYTLLAESSVSDASATNAIVRADLATGELKSLSLPEKPSSFATDGGLLFVALDGGLAAYDLDGRQVWRVGFPRLVVNHTDTFCAEPAVAGDMVYVGCTDWGRKVPKEVDPKTPPDEINGQMAAYVLAVNATSGERRWLWVKAAPSELQPPGRSVLQLPSEVTASSSSSTVSAVMGLSAVGAHALVTTYSLNGWGGLIDLTVWSLRAADGHLEWSLNSSLGVGKVIDPYAADLSNPYYAGMMSDPAYASMQTGTPYEVYIKDTELKAVNPTFGTENWRLPLGGEDQARGGWSGFALDGTTLYVAWAQTIYRVDTARRTYDVFASLPPDSRERWGSTGFIVARGVLYARSEEGYSRSVGGELDPIDAFYALTLDGTMLWRRPFVDEIPSTLPRHFDAAVSDGVMAVAGIDGSLTILGRTAGSIVPMVSVLTSSPGPGDEIRVDLSGSQPGIFGAPTAYRAEWGDGATTDWQEEGRLAHRYVEPGVYEAAFWARNPAGQSARERFQFRVEGPVPVTGQGNAQGASAADAALLPTATPPPSGSSAGVAAVEAASAAGLLLLLVGAVVIRRRRRARRRGSARASGERHSQPAEGPNRRRLETYRAALESSLHEGGSTERERAMLLRLRQELQISDQEHAVLEYALQRPDRQGEGSVPSLRPGQRFLDRYRVRRKLGEGGSGETFLCTDERVAREVVLKSIRAPLRGSGGLDALLREARAIGAIKHPNVVTLLDIEQVGGEAFLLMEFLEGGSLRDRIARRPLQAKEFAAVAADLLRALEAVHAAGIVHRDVKPSNVLLTREGRAKLADFGIAHIAGFETTAAAAHDGSAAVGTIRYMSPEQARGHAVTHRSDLFGAGATLYEAWTGRPYLEPRTGETAVELQMRAAAAESFNRPVAGPPELRSWFAVALAPSPGDRFASARAMREALELALKASASLQGQA